MANEFLVNKTAVQELVIAGGTAAFTNKSGIYIPAGAIITGFKIVSANTAITITGASQTVVPKVGTQVLGTTLNVHFLHRQYPFLGLWLLQVELLL